jgi:hypothetical protein
VLSRWRKPSACALALGLSPTHAMAGTSISDSSWNCRRREAKALAGQPDGWAPLWARVSLNRRGARGGGGEGIGQPAQRAWGKGTGPYVMRRSGCLEGMFTRVCAGAQAASAYERQAAAFYRGEWGAGITRRTGRAAPPLCLINHKPADRGGGWV